MKAEKTLAEVAAGLREKAGQAITVEGLKDALRIVLEEVAQREQAVYRSENEEVIRWRKERGKWIKGYRRIFRELPSLLCGIKEVVSALQEDVLFSQAPAAVQEQLRNRKEGLEIIYRMLGRLPLRRELLEKVVTDSVARPKRLELPTQRYLSRLEPLNDPEEVPAKVEEILAKIEQEEEKVRDDNYHCSRQLRQEAEGLKQAVITFLKDFLLPVIDGLERGIGDEEVLKRPLNRYQEEQKVVEQWFGAYPRCHQKMTAFLKKIELRRVQVKQGDEFDPQQHFALGHERCPELRDGQIGEVVRSGWDFYRVPIRLAEVVVVRNEGGNKDGPAG